MGPGGLWHLGRRGGSTSGNRSAFHPRGWGGVVHRPQPGPPPWLQESTRHVDLWGASGLSIPQPPTPGATLDMAARTSSCRVDKLTSRAWGTSEDRAGLASSPHTLGPEGCTAQTASVCPLVRHSLGRPGTRDKPSPCQPSPRPTSPAQGWGFPGGPQAEGPAARFVWSSDTAEDSWSRRRAAPTSSPPPGA